MKNMSAFLCLMLLSSTVFASESTFNGKYRAESGLRFFGVTKEECDADLGMFNESDRACYHDADNMISIETNDSGKTIVDINVLFGPANMRDFRGVVTKVKKNVLTVKEADIDDTGAGGNLIKGGCSLEIEIIQNKAILNLDENCDSDLARASGATKI